MKIYSYLKYGLIAGAVALGGGVLFKGASLNPGAVIQSGGIPSGEAGKERTGKELILSFLTRAREQKLLSPGYHQYLATVTDLVQRGRIKLEYLSLKEVGRDLSGRYFPPRDTLRVVIPDDLNDQVLRFYFESTLLH